MIDIMDSKHTTQEISNTHNCISAFDEWLLKKSRLERGQKILLSLDGNYFNVDEDDASMKTKENLLDELILCSAAIDCSIDNLKSKSMMKKTSMKSSLRKFLIQQGYSFDGIDIDKEVYEKFSEHAKDLIFEMVREKVFRFLEYHVII